MHARAFSFGSDPEDPAGSEQLDRIFGALSDRTRRQMLARLADGEATVAELGAPHDLSKSAITKHLKTLERAGLVRRAIDGRVHRCTLEHAGLDDARAWIDHYRRYWDSTLDSLEAFLREDSNPERGVQETSEDDET